jgi:iron(III) transport system ATP-binding protein
VIHPPILTLCDVTRRYDARAVVDHASFTLHTGKITCLLGPSGCGKSTILRMIAGLEPLDSGEISIHGALVSAAGHMVLPEKRAVGLVFQDNALFPHLNVRDNVGFGVQSLHPDERRDIVDQLLARFHIAHLATAWPHTLSGGEQQRVAIARALAREPVLLLLDEPFSNLDSHLRATIRQSLIADLRSVGTTVLVVTHDPEEAMTIGDELILMADGHILQTGDPEKCYDDPVSLTAARLLGDAISFSVHVTSNFADTPFGAMHAPDLPDGAAILIIRPADIVIADAGMTATIVSVRRLGREYVMRLAAGSVEFTIRCDQTERTVGQTVKVQLNPNSAFTWRRS